MQPPAQSEDSRPSVCRRLFADDDEDADQATHDGVRDNVLNQIHEEISRDLDDVCKKYNFDFRAEQPLEGDWVWERVVDPPSERLPQEAAPQPSSQTPPPAPPEPEPSAEPQPDLQVHSP